MDIQHGKYILCDFCEKEDVKYVIPSPHGDEIWDACEDCAERYGTVERDPF